MKFTNGYWLNKDNVESFGATVTVDVKAEQNCVTVFVNSKQISNRGQTLSGPLLTIEFTSPHVNVLGVRAYHFKGIAKCGPEFDLNTEDLPLTVTRDETGLTIASGEMSAKIADSPFSIRYYYGEKLLTVSDTKQLAYLLVDNEAYFRERLNISVGECIYGLGERFSAFVKNGQSVDIWNEDGGTSSEQAYKNVPFYVSNRGYGVYVNNPGCVSFEIGSEAVSKTQFSVKGEELNYFIFGGGLKQVLTNYTDMTGKPSLPPEWSFGLWLSTSFTTNYDEKTVNSFIDGMQSRGIPLSVFHFDCFWMKEYEWCNFEWDKEQFPEPTKMLAGLKEKGLKICAWINPYIGQKSLLFDEGMRNGFLIKKQDDSVWQWDLWQPGMAIVDFSNPEAAEWFKGYLRKLVQQGVDCFKTDFGERIPVDVKYSDGSDPHKMHNYYTYIYNKTVFDLLLECKGEREAVLFARSATVGCQQFPVHWGGDCEATYESMSESLRGGLSLSLGGFGFWSHDIGGFEHTATADLYKRWVAFGLLSTHSRLHGSSSYRVPWLFDEEAVDVLKFFVELKRKLMPYIYSSACETSKTGIPVMRPMFLEYTDDTICSYIDRQYMLGENLIVAPVFNPDGTAEVYLPKGRFTHLLTNESADGGCFIKSTYDYFGLHLWVKPNSIIVMTEPSTKAVYDSSSKMLVSIYEPDSNIGTDIYDNFGELMFTVSVKIEGDTAVVLFDGAYPGGIVNIYRNGKSAGIEVAEGSAESIILM